MREDLCLTTVRRRHSPIYLQRRAEDLVQKTIMLPLGDQRW